MKRCGVIWSRSCSTAAIASYPRALGTKYSVCSSAPLLGVKFILKCGSRSYQGPGIPICSVQLSAEWSAIGCIFRFAARRDLLFYPNLRGPMLLPVRKQTHAVPAGKDLLQILLQL